MHAKCTAVFVALEADPGQMYGRLHAVLNALYLALPGAPGGRDAARLPISPARGPVGVVRDAAQLTQC